jgi:flagellar biosynthesis GTPase FlhF
MKARGSKEEVYNGLALKTSGGLTKDQLIENSKGKIVSKAKHDLGKKAFGHLHKKAEPIKIEAEENQNDLEDDNQQQPDLEADENNNNNIENEKNIQDQKKQEQEENCYENNENSQDNNLNHKIDLLPDAVQENKSAEAEQRLENECKIPIEDSILNDVMKNAPVNAAAYPMIEQPQKRKQQRVPRKPIVKK